MPKKKKSENRPVLPVFRIFCEGEKTEPLYIKGYVSHFHSDKRNVIVVEKSNKNTPVQLVEAARDAKNEGQVNDVIWAVFDRESETKYPHHLHNEAREIAKTNGIEIALSNVCFEYWLLLHFTYTAASYSSCDDLLKKSTFKKCLKDIGINDYDKGLALLFDKLKNLVPDALENSERLKQQAIKSAAVGKETPHYLNPYVDVHEMFIDIKNFIEKKPSVRS